MSSPASPLKPDRLLFPERAFVLLVEYVAPLERIDELLDVHRAWLDVHFTAGTFLVSGPRVPRVGGAILATAPSRGHVEDAVASDPLVQAGVAVYGIVEFTPTRGPYAALGAESKQHVDPGVTTGILEQVPDVAYALGRSSR